jgi:hypothetical protein
VVMPVAPFFFCFFAGPVAARERSSTGDRYPTRA